MYINFPKLISNKKDEIFLFFLALSLISIIRYPIFDNVARYLIFIALITFIVLNFVEIIRNFKSILTFSLLIFLTISFGNSIIFFNFDYDLEFFKKILQILICIFLFFHFSEKKININFFVYSIFIILLFSFILTLLTEIFGNAILRKIFFFDFWFFRNFLHSDIIVDSVSQTRLNLLDKFLFRQNSIGILINSLILFYLIKNKFEIKNILTLFFLTITIFLSDNTFSKVITISLFICFYITQIPKFGKVLLSLVFVMIIIFLLIIYLIDLQAIINSLNNIIYYIFKIFNYQIDYFKYGYLGLSDNNFAIKYKVLSLDNFYSLVSQKDLSHMNNAHKIYFDYYFGIISRIAIFKFKLINYTNLNFVEILNSPFQLNLYPSGYLELTKKVTLDNDISLSVLENNNIILDLNKKLQSGYFAEKCINDDFSFITCLNYEIFKLHPNLEYTFYNPGHISQRLVSTHNSFLTLFLIFNKFSNLLLVNFIIIFLYLLFFIRKEFMFLFLGSILIMLFEDYLFFNRFNISIIFWILMAQCVNRINITSKIKSLVLK